MKSLPLFATQPLAGCPIDIVCEHSAGSALLLRHLPPFNQFISNTAQPPAGCPIDIVCDRSAGSALLRRPQKMEEIARAMSRSMSCPLTLKTRKGYNDGQDVSALLYWQGGRLVFCLA